MQIPSLSHRVVTQLAITILLAESIFIIWRLAPWETADSHVYLTLASNLTHGHWGRFVDGLWFPEGVRTPGYPALLVLLREWVTLGSLSIVIVQVSLVLGCIAFAKVLVPDRFRGWGLAVAIAAYPVVIAYAAQLMTEVLSISISVLLLVLLAKSPSPTPLKVASAGFLCGCAILIRPNLAVLALIPLLSWIFLVQTIGWRRIARATAMFSGAFGLTVSPMLYFNLQHHGRISPLPVPGAMAASLYIASWEGQLSLEDFNALNRGVITEKARAQGLEKEVRALNERIGLPGLTSPWTPEHYHPSMQRHAASIVMHRAIERIAEEPLSFARRTLTASVRVWITGPNSGVYGAGGTALFFAGLSLFCFGLCGALVGLRVGAPIEHRLCALMVVTVLVTQPWFHIEARYTAHARIPLAICALWLVEMLWVRLRGPLVRR